MIDGDRPSVGGASSAEVLVAEPTDEFPRRGRQQARRKVVLGLVVLLCVAAAAIPVAIRVASSDDARRPSRVARKHVNPNDARIQVGSALAATIAARSYRISSLLSEIAPAGASARGLAFRSEATVNVDPLAMVAIANVGGMPITSWTDGTRQWERGGANYGLSSPEGIGPGEPVSGFTSLVVGTLGPREGGVAMMSLASPNGHLDLADQAITAVSESGAATLDGSQLTEYDITVNASQLVNQPGMTAEQVKAATAGLRILQHEGYTHTTERLGIDSAGFIRESHTVWNFADGGAVTADTTFYDYGCAGTIVLPTQAPVAPPAATCTSPDPAATPLSTTTIQPK